MFAELFEIDPVEREMELSYMVKNSQD